MLYCCVWVGGGYATISLFSVVQNFTAVSTSQKPDFYLLPFRRYSGNKNGKTRETTNLPIYIHFSRSIGRIKKKLNDVKCFLALLLLESKMI